jgi:predicted nucleic acid-binding protein
MSMTLIDTDILIDTALQVSEAVCCLDELEDSSELAISVVTQMELIVGCRNKTELKKWSNFWNGFR